ncbi:MAG: hypothetical protein IPO15_11140 [Anaerolineae bacterium]|uniref:hypothetical protein n=1 Tax=Candidatus Amarolinea dominans TaxID=3140696 RepID=UPI0031376275|nr:hypothetical protein [Anaerolineae bacterium]
MSAKLWYLAPTWIETTVLTTTPLAGDTIVNYTRAAHLRMSDDLACAIQPLGPKEDRNRLYIYGT